MVRDAEAELRNYVEPEPVKVIEPVKAAPAPAPEPVKVVEPVVKAAPSPAPEPLKKVEIAAPAPAPSPASSSLVSRGPDPKAAAPSAASSSLISRGPDPRASSSLVSRGPAPAESARRPSQQGQQQPQQQRHGQIQAQPARPSAPQQRAPVPQPQAPRPVVVSTGPEVHLKPPYIVRYLAEALGMKPNDLISDLMKTMKVFVSITQALDQAKVEAYLALKGKKLIADKRESPSSKKEAAEAEPVIPPEEVKHPEKPEDRVPRAPIVAVMGHVDHGKTTLLDALRKTTVASGESGGITQHTGASVVKRKVHGTDYQVTFIDTPGHAAFSNMRKRGATTTDVCVLIVAADDGVNAQTKEALKIIQEAKTPFVVCITKMDLGSANPDRCMQQLQSLGLLTEEWGGDIGCAKVSARTGLGLDDLIERICLEAEVQEVKGNPKIPGKGIVLEAELEPGQGPTANIIVRDGTIRPGDFVICGETSGKVKALVDANGTRIKEAGPSIPCKLLGLDGVPDVGATLVVIKDEKEAKRIAEERREAARQEKLARGTNRVASMADLMNQVEENAKKTMRVLIKTDVRGTGEAIASELEKIPTDKVNLEIIGNSVGSISESDVQLAGGAGATILGFHVRVNPGVNKAAAAAKIEVKLYSIIYELLDDVRAQMTGLLTKLRKEVPIGKAEIMQVFFVKAGKICGSVVRQGKIKTNAQARVIRNREVIFNGAVKNLKRFKDDVKEVPNGVECGLLLNNFNDFEVGDIIEVYEYEEIAQSL
jgi:translation initiation factor IF-2